MIRTINLFTKAVLGYTDQLVGQIQLRLARGRLLL